MNYQVHLNPTRLSILSIPREKCWIFVGPILQLLYIESKKTNSFGDDRDEEISDSDNEENDFEDNFTEDVSYEFSDSEQEQEHERGREMSASGLLADCIAGRMPSSTRTDGTQTPPHRPKRKGSNLTSSVHLEKREVDNSSKTSNLQLNTLSVLHTNDSSSRGTPTNSDEESSFEEENYFFHVAYTPNECTVICSTTLFKDLFTEALDVCRTLGYTGVKVVNNEFLSMMVDSDGSLDNSTRILKLTKPLSENNIPLFFLSTHFSNIVLVPFTQKAKVIHTLTKQSFEFSDISKSFIAHSAHEQDKLDLSDLRDAATEIQPLDVEKKAFILFKHANIRPLINEDAKLLLSGARSGEVIETIHKTAKNIASKNIPLYFAITRTSPNEVSLILPGSSRKRSSMGFSSKNIVGSTQDVIIPIVINLRKLPLDSTGIVASLASRIVNGMRELSHVDSPVEMNYLSMAQSAIIMIPEEILPQVASILKSVNYDNLD